MSLTPADVAHLVVALLLLLTMAHSVGFLFRRWGQPQVIGEILGGTALGPTLLKNFLPDVYDFAFARNLQTLAILSGLHQFGLLLLLFCSGLEIRSHFRPTERRVAVAVTIAGTLVPFLFSIPLLFLIDINRYMGSAQSVGAFGLVFAISIAVTSIPVIARILMDLKLADTAFARIVLSSAVAEDIILYVLLSLALALGTSPSEETFDLPTLLGLQPGTAFGVLFRVTLTLGYLYSTLRFGPTVFAWLDRWRFNTPRRNNPLAFLILILLATTGVGILLGVAPMLAAFAAGAAAGRMHVGHPDAGSENAKEAIRAFAFAFFIPIYFAIVGLKLDLVHAFDPFFFLFFLIVACAVKLWGVYIGARAAGEDTVRASNLAVAMNARGGPGIVLASLALDARIIHERFYSALVMLSIVTSYLAALWLQRRKIT